MACTPVHLRGRVASKTGFFEHTGPLNWTGGLTPRPETSLQVLPGGPGGTSEAGNRHMGPVRWPGAHGDTSRPDGAKDKY